jgi:hypothetical protein
VDTTVQLSLRLLWRLRLGGYGYGYGNDGYEMATVSMATAADQVAGAAATLTGYIVALSTGFGAPGGERFNYEREHGMSADR